MDFLIYSVGVVRFDFVRNCVCIISFLSVRNSLNVRNASFINPRV